jgi:hypothetical protein
MHIWLMWVYLGMWSLKVCYGLMGVAAIIIDIDILKGSHEPLIWYLSLYDIWYVMEYFLITKNMLIAIV